MNVRGLAVFTACGAVISGAWPLARCEATADLCAPAIAAVEQAQGGIGPSTLELADRLLQGRRVRVGVGAL